MGHLRLVLLVAVMQLFGSIPASAQQVSVLVDSDPLGAYLVALDGHTILGTLPATRTYAPPVPWRECVAYHGFRIRWRNGAEVSVGRIELCPEGGLKQQVRVSVPAERTYESAAVASLNNVCRDRVAVYRPANGRCPVPGHSDETPLRPVDLAAASERPPNSEPSQRTALPVVLLDRRFGETEYRAVVPATIAIARATNAECFARTNEAPFANAAGDCLASDRSQTTFTPSRTVGDSVRGTTLSLLLPDRRIAVVNCARGSCRAPTGAEFEAELSGDKARLVWRVGLNGEEVVSETYDLVALLDAAGQ